MPEQTLSLDNLPLEHKAMTEELKREIIYYEKDPFHRRSERYAYLVSECALVLGEKGLQSVIHSAYAEIHAEMLKGFSNGQWVGNVSECVLWSTMSDKKRRELAEAKIAEEEHRQAEMIRREELRASAKQKEDKRSLKEKRTVRHKFRPCFAGTKR